MVLMVLHISVTLVSISLCAKPLQLDADEWTALDDVDLCDLAVCRFTLCHGDKLSAKDGREGRYFGGLRENTEYEVAVSALYAVGARSEEKKHPS